LKLNRFLFIKVLLFNVANTDTKLHPAYWLTPVNNIPFLNAQTEKNSPSSMLGMLDLSIVSFIQP
jgi:hypothetical protein